MDIQKTIAETAAVIESSRDKLNHLEPQDKNHIDGYLAFVCEELEKPEPDWLELIARVEKVAAVLAKYQPGASKPN